MKKIVFIFLALIQCLLAQRVGKPLNGEDFGAYGLPTRIGDAWNYRDYYFRPEFKIELIDTVRINGEKYFRQKETYRDGYVYDGVYIRLRDDGFYVALDSVFGGPLRNKQDYIYYKKNAQVGDFWIQKRNVTIDRFIYHKIIRSSTVSSFWGTWIPTKVVDVTDSVLTRYWEYWSEELGKVRLPYRYLLWGCVVNGVQYGDTTLVSVEDSSSINPTDFDLYQNYPNPFNPTTKIRYSIKYNGLVTLKVFDLLSREVAMLVNELQSVGMYEIEFDGNKYGLSSGVYFYQLRSGSFTQTKKFVYLR